MHVIQVYGMPVAQGRPRAFKTPRGRVRVYDPSTSRDWKRTVQAQVILAWKPRDPLVGPLQLALVFSLPRPKTLPKRIVQHTKRPDVDNLAKAILDAVRGILFRDDSAIVSLTVIKRYGESPGMEIAVTEWG